jgi:FlaA1/EpsC-like NDP-sugar epimerase
VIVGKPLIVMVLMRFIGYKKRTNFLIGSSLAQISEFSLILILIGYKAGHINQELMNLCIIVALVTIGASSYTIYHSHSIFNSISRFLSIFEGKANKEHEHSHDYKSKSFNIIVFGYHRMGSKLVQVLKKQKESFLVVDYNPKKIMQLTKENIPAIYGDANDSELLEELNLEKVKLVISTIPEESPNLLIKKYLKEIKSQAIFIATAEYAPEAVDLYKEGVDFVLLPHILGGAYAAELIEKNKFSKEKYKETAEKQKKDLSEKEE